MSILGWIVLGLIAGWLAGVLVKGSGYGVIGDIILGILGAIVGGWITSTLMGVDVTGFNLESLLVAVLGAIVVIFIASVLSLISALVAFLRDIWLSLEALSLEVAKAREPK